MGYLHKHTKYSSNFSFYVFFLFQFEILFCVQEESDPAIMIVQKLMELYPKVDAKLFIGNYTYSLSR